MKKSVSILAVMLFGVMSAFPSNGAQMTSQIQRLLEQKEEKIKKLEECEGKKKGWMIAGLSTIGVTAVGVGVNIAQAGKSNKLSGEIDAAKTELERQQDKLSGIESQSVGGSGGTGKCSCLGCKKSLNISKQTYTCGSENVPENTIAVDRWVYICDKGCWKGVDTVGYRNVPDCTDGQMTLLTKTNWFATGTINQPYVFYTDNIDNMYNVKNICKIANQAGSVSPVAK